MITRLNRVLFLSLWGVFLVALSVDGLAFAERVRIQQRYQENKSTTTESSTTTTGTNNKEANETKNGPVFDIDESRWPIVNDWIDLNAEIKSGWAFSGILLAVAFLIGLVVCCVFTCTNCFGNGEESAAHPPGSPSILSSAFGTTLSKASSMTGRSSGLRSSKPRSSTLRSSTRR